MSDKIVHQETEYGFRTPNGEEYFPKDTVDPRRGPNVPFEALDTERGQALAQTRYQGILRDQGIPEEGNVLAFIQRVRTVMHSATIPLPPQPDEEPVNIQAAEPPHPFGPPIRQNRV